MVDYWGMGIFNRKKAEPRVGNHEGKNEFLQNVVGEKSFRENLIRIIKQNNAFQTGELFVNAYLIPEPKNDFDPNAILVQIEGYKVGYISRAETNEFHVLFKEHNLDALQVKARIGWDINNAEPLIGVQLDVNWDED